MGQPPRTESRTADADDERREDEQSHQVAASVLHVSQVGAEGTDPTSTFSSSMSRPDATPCRAPSTKGTPDAGSALAAPFDEIDSVRFDTERFNFLGGVAAAPLALRR